MNPLKTQQGVVLIVALVMMLILTIAGISAMRLSVVEERMTSNYAERNIAFQSAEAALVDAESYLKQQNFQEENFFNDCDPSNGTVCFQSNCKGGLCFDGTFTSNNSDECNIKTTNTSASELYQKASIWADSDYHKVASIDLDESTGILAPAKYIVEFRCFVVKDPITQTDADFLNDRRYDSTYWEPMYRITALGSGRNPNTRVMLQTTYRRN